MLNTIWPIFIIVSIAFAIVTGRVSVINDAIFASTKDTVDLCITLLGTLCLWNRNNANCITYKDIRFSKKIN